MITEIREFISELEYQSYKFNRENNPKISVQDWKLIFKDAESLERRYQAENNIN